jgi:hypothetical protein
MLVPDSSVLPLLWNVFLLRQVSQVLCFFSSSSSMLNLYRMTHRRRSLGHNDSKENQFSFRFSSDTCTALENFQQNPYNNSLSSILPCEELQSAKSVLFDFSGGIYSLVNEVK